MRLLIGGGGTGGHIYPGIAVARYVRDLNVKNQVLYVGTKTGMEADIVVQEGFDFQPIAAQGWQRKLSTKTIPMIVNNSLGIIQSLRIVKQFKPDVVLGTGGYVAAPLVFAAALLKIPIVLHEQNAVPGITNRVLSRWAHTVALSFEETTRFFPPSVNKVITGNPVRQGILDAEKSKGIARLGLDTHKQVVLVFGGSRGARTINTALVEGVKDILDKGKAQIIHLTGQEEYSNVVQGLKGQGIELDLSGNIVVKPYLYEMADALAAADLVVCRAGATTLAELTAIGKPSILIPYPYATDNHQEKNARAIEAKGAALIVKDSELEHQTLANKIIQLLGNSQMLSNMASNSATLGKREATKEIVDCLHAVVKRY